MEEQLPWGAAQQVITPHHLGHALSVVVDHHRDLIRGRAVALSDQEVADLFGDVLALHPAQPILKLSHAGLSVEAHTSGLAALLFCLRDALVTAAASARVDLHLIFCVGRRLCSLYIPTGTRASVSRAGA